MTVLVLALSLLVESPASLLRGYERHDLPAGPVFVSGWSRSRIEWAERFLAPSLARIEERLGRSIGHPVTTVLVNGPAELQRLVRESGGTPPPDTVVGVALPAHRLMVVRADALSPGAPDGAMPATLVHELAHLVIHRNPDTRVPRWLDEGIAMRVSQGSLSVDDAAYLSLLARAGSLYPLESLDGSFPPQHGATTVAYRQSLLLVEFIEEGWGEAALRGLLDAVEAGRPWRGALEELTALDLETFQDRFERWVASRVSLAALLARGLNLWVVAGPLALLAVLRYWWKRRRAMRRLVREDEDADPGG